jgi:DNA-binding NarL/FixJ family response regulator
MDDSEAAFLQAVRAGASGYLLKNASASEVLTAIRAVSQGQAVCPPTLCAALFKIAARPQSPVPAMDVSLTSVPAFRLPVICVPMTGVPMNLHSMNLHSTPRQPELVSLIAQGLTNHEIAARLNLAAQTIENHVHRISGKVGTDERAKVVEITRVRNAVL